MRRAAVFIDGGYLDKVLEPLRQNRRVNIPQLIESLVSKARDKEVDIIRIYYYHCPPFHGNPPTQEQSVRLSKNQKFHRALQLTSRFEVRLGRLAYRGDDHDGNPIYEQKRVDLLLGIDLTMHAVKRTVEAVFLVAGDSDFLPAIGAAKSEGIITYLIHGKGAHDDLMEAVDDRILITQELVDDAARSNQ